MRLHATTLFLFAVLLAAPTARSGTWTPMRVRTAVYHTDPCLARIVDRENRSWSPTRYGLGGSYGLPQASPPQKMASAGRDWRVNPFTQLKWMAAYTRQRYGGSCRAWAWWQAHRWY